MATQNIKSPIIGPPKLNIDVRLIIWRLLYAIELPGIVEVQTAEHDNCNDHRQGWCPRYSPSPAPTVVNICHEARHEAQRIARKAGHVLFLASQPKDLPPIYFDSAVDTLYIRNEKEYWIRDWWGPAGVLTQLKHACQPELLRVLAIELDPIDRATSRRSFRGDLQDFPNLEDVIFVVAKPDDNIFKLAGSLDDEPRFMNIEAEYIERRGLDRRHGLIAKRTRLKGCKLAIRCGRRFDFVDFT